MLVSKFKYLLLQKNIQGCTNHSVKTNLGSSYKVRPEITNMFRYLKWRYWTLQILQGYFGGGFPLDKPYPYSLFLVTIPPF